MATGAVLFAAVLLLAAGPAPDAAILKTPALTRPQVSPPNGKIDSRAESRVQNNATTKVDSKRMSATAATPPAPAVATFERGRPAPTPGILPNRTFFQDQAGTARALADYFRQSRQEYKLRTPYNEGFGRSFNAREALGNRIRVAPKGAGGLDVYEATDSLGNKVTIRRNARGGFEISDGLGNTKTITEHDLLDKGTRAKLPGRR